MYYVYMIKDNADKLYVGISKDPNERLRVHNAKSGANFTHHGNFKIVFLEKYQTLMEARSREVQIKKWRREKKEILILRYDKGLETRL